MDNAKVLQAIETLHEAGLLKWEPQQTKKISKDTPDEWVGHPVDAAPRIRLLAYDNGDVALSIYGRAIPTIPETSPLAKVAKAAAAQAAVAGA